MEDIQHTKGHEPYSSSKYAADLLNVALNRNFNQKARPVSEMPKLTLSELLFLRGEICSTCPFRNMPFIDRSAFFKNSDPLLIDT